MHMMERYFEIAVPIAIIIFGPCGFCYLIKLVKRPVIKSLFCNYRLRKSGYKNTAGEFMTIKSIRKNKHKENGLIYTLNNEGISIQRISSDISKLEGVFLGKIGNINPGKSPLTTTIEVMPYKYVKPLPISETMPYLAKDIINLLVVGNTGSGKSYAMHVILGAIIRFNKIHSITICDYKKSSFSQFEDTPNFYGYEDVPKGIRAFYQEFTERLEANDPERNKQKRVLLIDEYGALISAQPKKEADELRTMVANMLFMARSLGLIVIIGVQRADAEHFKTGARDQFKAILGMSNLSKEQRSMLFSEHKDTMTAINGVGEGYLMIDGNNDVDRIKVMRINDPLALDEEIRRAMCV